MRHSFGAFGFNKPLKDTGELRSTLHDMAALIEEFQPLSTPEVFVVTREQWKAIAAALVKRGDVLTDYAAKINCEVFGLKFEIYETDTEASNRVLDLLGQKRRVGVITFKDDKAEPITYKPYPDLPTLGIRPLGFS